jgi:hypothetical protein
MGGRSKPSPERLVKAFSRIPKNAGTLPKMRTFLGKVKEMFAKAHPGAHIFSFFPFDYG